MSDQQLILQSIASGPQPGLLALLQRLAGGLGVAGALVSLRDLREERRAAQRQTAGGDAQVLGAALPAGRVVDQGQAELLGVAVVKVRGDLYLSRRLLPKTLAFADQLTIFRTLRSNEEVHFRGQYYTQAGRPFQPAFAKEIPPPTAVISMELESQRREQDSFPTACGLALEDSRAGVIPPGFLPAKFATLDISPDQGLASMAFDPKTGRFTLISTCFPTHHLVFAEDANHTLWTSAGGAGAGVVGWLDRKLFEETGDEARAQGWTPFVLDTNGNGKRDDYVEPNQPIDPAKDKRIVAGFYGVAVSPVDGTVWGSSLGFPGSIIRVSPGPDPTHTALSEVYEVPGEMNAYGIRGMDIDRNGVVWSSLASGHLASFDRRKCKGPLNGPKATGKHCPEGWAFYSFPGPNFKGAVDAASADSAYYNFVDRFDMLGVGKDIPLSTGNLSESLLAFVDGKFMTLRVPYPMGFFAKGLDGRIDSTSGGWKGKGIFSTYATRAPFHSEGGKGTTSKLVKFQMRPDPLAK